MPNALTNTNISATYKGVLHANGEPIPDVGLKPVYDGTGVQSALSIGRTNQGATVSGLLQADDVKAGQLRMPNVDKGIENHVVARTTAGVLELKSLSEIIGGSTIADDVYDNPRITVVGGVITKIESRPSIVILDNPVVIVPYNVITLSKTQANGTYNYPFTNVVWKDQQGYYAGASSTIPPRYAIITVEMYAQTESLFYETFLEKDSVVIARALQSGNYTEREEYLDNNRYIYNNQIIVKIPSVNETSTFNYRIRVDDRTFIASGRGTYNTTGPKVTLDGWVY